MKHSSSSSDSSVPVPLVLFMHLPAALRTRPALWSLLGLGILSLVGGYLATDWYTALPEAAITQANYVGRQSCISCHQAEAESFHGSHHDLAMDLATDETVLGRFDGTEIEHYGITSKVYRDGEKFMVRTEGPDGQMGDFEVKYVFGVEPLQQYMVEFGRTPEMSDQELGRVQVLRLSWDTEQERWFYLTPPDVKEKLDPTDPLHWTGVTQNWNSSCADCHSTNLQKNFDPQSGQYRTTFSEIDVSCEACHGPGSVHIELANRRSLFWDRRHGYGLAKLKTENNVPEIESCAPCHSRRSKIADGYHAGRDFHDYFAHGLINELTYHADGQILDEVYVYGSFVQSKMFHQNIRCTDCHDPHTTKLKFSGNLVCTSCHQHPSGKYDTPAHHQHKPGSPGAQCVNCHMPASLYMDVDWRRDHSLRVPRPDLSIELGTPNACTGCHLDKQDLPVDKRAPIKQYQDWLRLADEGDAEVAAEVDRVNQQMLTAFLEWYGDQDRSESLAEPLTEVWQDRNQASERTLAELADWVTDRKQPAMYRASAALELANFRDPTSLKAALEALQAKEPSVITASLGRLELHLDELLQEALGPRASRRDYRRLEEFVDQLTPLLQHSSRWVRTATTRVLSRLPLDLRRDLFERDTRQAFDQGLEALIDQYLVSSDRAMAWVGLGTLYENLGRVEEAVDAYRTGIFVESRTSGPRANLAALLETQAEQTMREAQRAVTERRRDDYERLMEQARTLAAESAVLRQEEVELLRVDVERLPDAAPLQYRYGLALHNVGREEEALNALARAYELNPQEPQYVLALTLVHERLGKWQEALRLCDQLLELVPDDPGFQNVKQRILQGQARGRPLDREPIDKGSSPRQNEPRN